MLIYLIVRLSMRIQNRRFYQWAQTARNWYAD